MQFNVRFRITPDLVQTRLKYLAKPRVVQPLLLFALYSIYSQPMCDSGLHCVKAFVSKFPALFFTWLKVLAKARLPIVISVDSFNKIAHHVRPHTLWLLPWMIWHSLSLIHI